MPTEQEKYAEKAKRLQEAYDVFVARLEELEKEELGLAKSMVERIEKKKIQEILDELKKL